MWRRGEGGGGRGGSRAPAGINKWSAGSCLACVRRNALVIGAIYCALSARAVQRVSSGESAQLGARSPLGRWCGAAGGVVKPPFD